jgi:elongation factor P
MKYDNSQFKNGLKIELDGNPYSIVYFQFVKPGKGTAFTRTKLKNLLTGAVIDRTFRSGEKVDAADIEEHSMVFLYDDGEMYHFMNNDTFDQVGIPNDVIKDESPYLTENLEVDVLFYKDRPVNISLPNFIEDEISECEPGVRGNTAQGATKQATLACGATIKVPLFIEIGERVKVDTRTKDYVERVKS